MSHKTLTISHACLMIIRKKISSFKPPSMFNMSTISKSTAIIEGIADVINSILTNVDSLKKNLIKEADENP